MQSLLRGVAAVSLACAALFVQAATPAEQLRARHDALAPELAHNAFQLPLHIESAQTSGDLRGDVYAVVDQPFATLDAALKAPEAWCDVLILHLNVKYCRAGSGDAGRVLAVSIGKKHDEPLSDAYRVNFDYRLAANDADYFAVVLNASEGPLGTRDYRIIAEAIPLDARHSFLHMSYAYGYGFAARLAMQGYLSTVGSGKVGFSVVNRRADGEPVYVGNVRGVVERNTMRYYLAIEAYLASLQAPPAQRQEQRLRDWFSATERYARQLHEIDRSDYLAMKHHEIERQQAELQTAKAG